VAPRAQEFGPFRCWWHCGKIAVLGPCGVGRFRSRVPLARTRRPPSSRNSRVNGRLGSETQLQALARSALLTGLATCLNMDTQERRLVVAARPIGSYGPRH